MNLEPSHHDDVVLPPFLGKIFAVFVMAVALVIIYYGVHDGVITQDIMFRTKAGKVSGSKGIWAVIFGLAFSGIGVALGYVAVLIFKSSKRVR